MKKKSTRELNDGLSVMPSYIDDVVELEREDKTVDIVKRLGVVTADRVHLTNHAADNPVTLFNPALLVENDDVKIYARIVLGYFTYTSAVIELELPIAELNYLSEGHYSGRIVIKPDNRYDIWGVEDPRACIIRGKAVITYSGRTVNYFRPGIERVLPIVAVREASGWKKVRAFTYRGEQVVSDKDAFLTDMNGLTLFHRLHTQNDEYYSITNDVPADMLDGKELVESALSSARIVLKAASFEDKIGWGTPPVKVGKEYLMLLHGVDNNQWYKVFAVLMNNNKKITAVTRFYIMEPKESYEVYGDRPFTVFPCGLAKVDDKLLVSYGAADFATAIGGIDLSQLMSLLDKNRV
jgi:predicted GH43/DUF377 family glycosyl hydrolase